jgi:hypothetical protein
MSLSTADDHCKWCCSDPGSDICSPLNITGDNPYFPDGAPCLHGYCENVSISLSIPHIILSAPALFNPQLIVNLFSFRQYDFSCIKSGCVKVFTKFLCADGCRYLSLLTHVIRTISALSCVFKLLDKFDSVKACSCQTGHLRDDWLIEETGI